MATGAAVAAWVGVAISAASAGNTAYEAQKSKTKQGKIDDLNLQQQQAQNAEDERRTRNEQLLQEGRARSLAAGGGLENTGSVAAGVEGLVAENVAQLKWLKTAGSSKLASKSATASANKSISGAKVTQAGAGFVTTTAKGVGTGYEAGQKAGIWQ